MNDRPSRTETDPDRVRRLLLCLDGLRFSFAVCLSSHLRAMQALRSFEPMYETGVPTDAVAQVIGDIWSVVDSAYRIRLLINSTPLIPKRDPEIRIFMDATTPVESLRHYVQHLNGEIGALPPSAPPLWGGLSWVSEADPVTCFTLVAGSSHLATSLAGLVFDTHTGRFVCELELTAGNTRVDLSDLVRRVRSLSESVCNWANTIQFSYGGASYEFKPALSPLFVTSFRTGIGSTVSKSVEEPPSER